MPAIGIDLGTCNSVVSVFKGGRIETLINQEGQYETPSHVTFSDGEALVGEPARTAALSDPECVHVFNAKRLMGRSYEEWRSSGTSLKDSPFDIIVNDGDVPKYAVRQEGTKFYSAVEISSMVLKKLKDAAEDALAQPVHKAVITVPANFNYSQRLATEQAAKLAGLEVLRLCSEPVMAFIAYHATTDTNLIQKTVLVFDCGGGTTDIAIVKIQNDQSYDVRATAGDMNLGGETLVEAMVGHFLEKVRTDQKKDVGDNKEIVQLLRLSCEAAKRQLSSASTALVGVANCDLKASWKLSRTEFEAICSNVLNNMVKTIDDALMTSRLQLNDIDEVLLVGGSSRIPALQDRIKGKLWSSKIRQCASPDHAIAEGAAYMAAKLSGEKCTLKGPSDLHEIAPLSIGVSLLFDKLKKVVPRGQKLPFEDSCFIGTGDDDQTGMQLSIFEGERVLAEDVQKGFLGTLRLDGFPKARKGEIKCELVFKVTASGILEVTASEPRSGKTAKLQLMSQNRQRDAEMVRHLIKDAEKNAKIDAAHQVRLDCLNNFRNKIYKRKHYEMDNMGDGRVIDVCQKLIDKLDAKSNEISIEAIPRLKAELDAALLRLKAEIVEFDDEIPGLALAGVYGNVMRQCTLTLTKLKGIDECRIVNVSHALYLKYEEANRDKIKPPYLLVFSIGSRHLEIAMFESRRTRMDMVAVTSARMGGNYIDAKIADYIMARYQPNCQRDDIVEQCKILKMSYSSGTEILLLKIGSYSYRVTRQELESQVLVPYFQEAENEIWKVVRCEPGEIMISGGCWKIQLLQNCLALRFPGVRITKDYLDLKTTVIKCPCSQQLPSPFLVEMYISAVGIPYAYRLPISGFAYAPGLAASTFPIPNGFNQITELFFKQQDIPIARCNMNGFQNFVEMTVTLSLDKHGIITDIVLLNGPLVSMAQCGPELLSLATTENLGDGLDAGIEQLIRKYMQANQFLFS